MLVIPMELDMLEKPSNRGINRQLAVDFPRISELKLDPKNARVHSPKQIKQIGNSILRFDFTNPILTDEKGNVIAGHGRIQAAKELGLETIPRIVIPGLTEWERKALAIADNKIALNSAWDPDLLRETIELVLAEVDLTELGFEVGEIDLALSSPSEDPDDDTVPAVPAAPVTVFGDIWIVGPHRIGNGDARDGAFLRDVLAGAEIATAFHDGPYNVPIDGYVGGKGKGPKHREFAMAVGEMSSAEFIRFNVEAFSPGVAFSRHGAVHYICIDHHHIEDMIAACSQIYGDRLNICIWNKSNAGMGGLYRSKHEFVLVYRVGNVPHRNNVELGRHGRNRTNVWDYPSVNTFAGSRRQDLALHPTVKPVGLVADAIKDVTKRGEVVLDSFLGSGTTLIACDRTGRVCRGIEFDPGYVDVALNRYRAMTGVEPVMAETGETFDSVARRRASERSARHG